MQHISIYTTFLQGLMTARYIPNGRAEFLITAGHGLLYLLDADQQAAKSVSTSSWSDAGLSSLPSSAYISQQVLESNL
jgi:hypothetical protein